MSKMGRDKRVLYMARCKNSVDSARGYRKHNGLDDLWKRMLDLYKGKHFPQDMGYGEAVAVNIAFSTINVIGPSVAVNRPKTVIRARRPEDVDKATIAEAVVNYWWDEFDVLPEFQRGVKDSLIFGIGWLKAGYRFVEEDEYDVEGARAELSARRAQVDAYAAENPEMANELPTDDELAAGIVSTKSVVKHDAPFVERVSVFDMYVDPEATSLSDAKWVAQKLTKTLDEVRGNERYKSSERRTVKPDARLHQDWFSAEAWSDRDTESDRQRVTVWEFYDLERGQMCVFADLSDDFLVDPVSQPYAFGHPFIDIRNYEVPDQFYPMGELEALEPLQAELNMTRTAMFNDRKAYRRAWLFKAEAFDPAGRAQLQSDVDNRLIPVSGNMPLTEALVPLPTASPNPQLYQDSSVIESDIQTVTGLNEYMRGSSSEIRRTATEASIIQDSANARAADKLARVESVISVVSRRMLQLAQQYLSSDKVARISGRGGRDMWVAYTREDIDLEADFSVEGGSSQPRNEAQRRNTAMQMLQALAPFGDPKMGLVNMREVLRHALQYGFDVEDATKFLGDQMDPAVAGLGGEPEHEHAPHGPSGDAAEQGTLMPAHGHGGPPPDQAAMMAQLNQMAAAERSGQMGEGQPAPTDALQGAY